MNRTFKMVVLWMSLLAVIFLAWHFAQVPDRSKRVPFGEILPRIEGGEVTFVSVRLQGNGPAAVFCVYLTDDSCVRSSGVFSDGVMDLMRKAQVPFEVQARDPDVGWPNMLISWAPFILLIGFWVFFMRQMRGANINDMKKAVFSRLDREPVPTGTVAASSAATLAELRSLTSGPPRPGFTLLTGLSGSGKSYLLRALFARSSRPCLLAESASFVEMFVGTGASRVRDLMTRAREEKAAVVIIDGIDDLCPRRAAGSRPERDERVQATRQLATCLDELRAKPACAFIGVTNRPELLDEAIVQRFERVLTLGAPDAESREALLREMLLSDPGVDVRSVVARTEGWLPGDLEAAASDVIRRAVGRLVEPADVDAALRAREEVRALATRVATI